MDEEGATTPFLGGGDFNGRSSEATAAKRSRLKVAAALLLATAALIGTAASLLGSSDGGTARGLKQTGGGRAAELDALPLDAAESFAAAAASNTFKATIATSNEYGETSHGKDYPWLANKYVVEPYKYTTLTLKYDAKVYGKKMTFNWKLTEPGASSTTATFSGSTIKTSFTKLGSHKIDVVAFDESGAKVGGLTTTAHSVYVKREVRSLTEEDREAFLDAMHTVWSLGTQKGRQLYGPDFTGMDRFVSVHADQATGDIKCDHWHEGSGFLTHHLALSTSFDMSLQAVDKRVSTPYWDFSVEGETLLKAGLGPKGLTQVSSMFTSAWFGSTDALSHVVDGRWAHAAAAIQVKASGVKNSYGLIRAPWNNVKDRELTRHMSDVCGLEPVNKPVPTCATHFKVMNVTKLSTFLMGIAGYGHGTMHVNLGGVYGACTGAMSDIYTKYADDLSEVLTMKDVAAKVEAITGTNPGWHTTTPFSVKMLVEKYIHLEYFHIYRTLWRSQTCALDGLSNALSCPESCDEETPESECVCTCKGIDASNGNANFDWQNLEECMYASESSKTIFQAVASESLRKDLITMFCSAGVKEGEMLESASPSDPMFWMIHPLLDRMLVAKRLATSANAAALGSHLTFGSFGKLRAFEDETWLDVSAYTTSDYTCEGHGMYDEVLADLPLPPHLIAAGDANGDGILSNIEFYEVTDPNNGEGGTYIYDAFTWSHCGSSDGLGDGGSDAAALGLTSVGTFASEGVDAAADGSMIFEGGVNPTIWDAGAYETMKPEGQTPNPATTEAYRAAKAAAKKANAAAGGVGGSALLGKSLKRVARLPGSKADYDAVISVLEGSAEGVASR